MNVYDFDGTIYRGDSSLDFLLYIAGHHFGAFIKCLPAQMGAIIAYVCDKCSRQEMKEQFFGILRYLPEPEQDVRAFWDSHENRIRTFFRRQHEEGDVIISASPDFLLQEIAWRLGNVTVIATDMDIHSGKIRGKNCKGREKARRFRAVYPNARIDSFYSDNTSDRNMAAMARQAYLVRGERILKWGRI